MNWQNLTQEEKNALIHSKVMDKPLHEPCITGELNVYHGAYLHCTCGWVSAHFIAEDDYPEHAVPIPDYIKDWNAVWQVLRRMVEQYCVWTLDGYGEVWCRFTYALNQVHPLEPNIYPWIAMWTPELLAKSAYYGVTGEEL